MEKPSHPPTTCMTRRQLVRSLRRASLGVVGIGLGLSSPTRSLAEDALSNTQPAPNTSKAPNAGPSGLSRRALDQSAFAYISPLLRNSQESTCHAELWYAWLDDALVVTVSATGWKAQALSRGLDRARIWIGDHGRWKTWYGGRNEAFRKAPSFVARAEFAQESDLLDRLLGAYEVKYPDEIADWRDRMRQGNADGSRLMLRYRPLT